MKMKRSFRVMLCPNNKQETRMFQYAGTCRFIYNWALANEMEAFRNGSKRIGGFDLRKELTQMKKTPEYAWLNTVSNNVAKQAVKDLEAAYDRFFEIQRETHIKYTKKKLAHLSRIGKKPTVYDMNGHPKFKKKGKTQPAFFQDGVKLQVTETHVKLEGLAGSKKKNRQALNWIRLAETGRIPISKTYGNPRVTYDGEHWWISVTMDVLDREKKGVYGDGIGIDLGIKKLAVMSDGKELQSINKTKKIKKLEKVKRRLQRQVSRKYQMNKKGERYEKTCNLIKSEKRILRIDHKLNAIRQNYVQQATTALVEQKPSFICMEDLNVQGMMQNKHLAKAVQDQGFYEFRREVEYKAEVLEIPVIIADRYYPSSKTCSRCGHVKKDLKLSERTFHCPSCGQVIDRDFQAALNLKHYAEKELGTA